MIKSVKQFIKSFLPLQITEEMVKAYIVHNFGKGYLIPANLPFEPYARDYIISVPKEFLKFKMIGVIDSSVSDNITYNGIKGFVDEDIYRSSSVFNVYTEEGICFRGVDKAGFKMVQRVPVCYTKYVTVVIQRQLVLDFISLIYKK